MCVCVLPGKKLKRFAVIISPVAVGAVGLITPNRIGGRQGDFPHPTIILYTDGAVGTYTLRTF